MARKEKQLPDVVGEYLKAAREEKGLSLRDVEERTGLSNSYLSQIERGRRTPSSDALAKLAPVYGRQLADLTYLAGKHGGAGGEDFRRRHQYEQKVDLAYETLIQRHLVDQAPPHQVEEALGVPWPLRRLVVRLASQAFGEEILAIPRRYRFQITDSHDLTNSSFEIEEDELAGTVYVRRSEARRFMDQPLSYLNKVTDEDFEWLLAKEKPDSVQIGDERYYDLKQLLKLQLRFGEVVDHRAEILAAESLETKRKGKRRSRKKGTR